MDNEHEKIAFKKRVLHLYIHKYFPLGCLKHISNYYSSKLLMIVPHTQIHKAIFLWIIITSQLQNDLKWFWMISSFWFTEDSKRDYLTRLDLEYFSILRFICHGQILRWLSWSTWLGVISLFFKCECILCLAADQ